MFGDFPDFLRTFASSHSPLCTSVFFGGIIPSLGLQNVKSSQAYLLQMGTQETQAGL